MEGDRGDKEEGACGNRERERDLPEGAKQEQKLQKHSSFVLNCVKSSVKASTRLTSTEALKILL